MAPLLRALDGAGLGHIAAHGRFRSDNVLFSSLRLHDGELTVYDLENMDRPPALLVLAACDVGMSEIHAGDELMGVAAEVLSMGTRTVIATLLPVPDGRVRQLMERCTDGCGPARPRRTPWCGRAPTSTTARWIRCRASSASAPAGVRPAGPTRRLATARTDGTGMIG